MFPGRSLVAAVVLLALPACERERRDLTMEPSEARTPRTVRRSQLVPGPVPDTAHEERDSLMPAETSATITSDRVAWDMSQGKTLFVQLNCAGCHSYGGGGMGPALMDRDFRYGSSPAQVYASITQGRPNGMPSFAGRLADAQVWQLVSYVRSMSDLVPFHAAPGRDDDLFPGQPENSREGRP